MKKRFKYLSCLLAVLFSLVLCFLLRSEPPIASEEIRGKATFTTQIQATSNRLQSRSPGATDPLRDFQKTDFYRTIVDNNLFRPLGWRPARPREPYRLLGTLLPNDGETPPQAILQSTTARTTYESIHIKIDIAILGKRKYFSEAVNPHDNWIRFFTLFSVGEVKSKIYL